MKDPFHLHGPLVMKTLSIIDTKQLLLDVMESDSYPHSSPFPIPHPPDSHKKTKEDLSHLSKAKVRIKAACGTVVFFIRKLLRIPASAILKLYVA